MATRRLSPLLAALLLPTAGLLTSAGPAAADDKALLLELNNLEQSGPACRVAFLARNELGADLKNVSFEIVIFDAAGKVQRLTVFDFAALPSGRARVRQFELPQTQCEAVGRILVNGVSECAGEGVEPGACEAGLGLSNKTPVEFLG